MEKQEQSKWKFYRRDEAIFDANEILKAKAPDVPLVTNVGRAALVLGLDGAGRYPDYRPYEGHWTRLRAGSSFTESDAVPFTIIAKEYQAFELFHDPEGFMIGDVLEAADKLWLGDPKLRVQLTNAGEPVVIDGKSYPKITAAQHAVVVTLLRSGRRMTGPELADESGVPDARGVLTRLCKKSHWKKVINFPKSPHAGGYGIR